jgi:hypothetical protein
MNAKRLMAMMTARGFAIGTLGGGMVEITRADVAAGMAFAGIGATAERLIRVAYCGDGAQVPLLKAALVHDVCKLVGTDRATSYQLVALALCELFGQRLCRTCNGTGIVAAKPCQVCDGSGLKAWSQRARAEALSVPQTTFRRDLEANANKVYQYVCAMEQQALAALSKQFTERAA